MNEEGRRLKKTVYAMLLFFVAVFVVGFLPGPSNLFLLPLLLHGLTSLVLLSLTWASTAETWLRRLLFFTAFSAVGFTAGTLYGALGMRGSYEIYDPVYLTVVIGSVAGVVFGAAASLLSLRSA